MIVSHDHILLHIRSIHDNAIQQRIRFSSSTATKTLCSHQNLDRRALSVRVAAQDKALPQLWYIIGVRTMQGTFLALQRLHFCVPLQPSHCDVDIITSRHVKESMCTHGLVLLVARLACFLCSKLAVRVEHGTLCLDVFELEHLPCFVSDSRSSQSSQ